MKEHQFRISKEIHTEGKQCQCRKCGNFGLLLYKNTWRNHFQILYIHMSCLQCAIQERNHINARNAGSHFQEVEKYWIRRSKNKIIERGKLWWNLKTQNRIILQPDSKVISTIMVRNNTNARIEEKYAFSNEHEEDNWSGNSAKLTHNGEKPYQCKKCRKSFFGEEEHK